MPDAGFLSCITPVILTYNEAANIERTLARLSWAKRVLILDSLSTDDTQARCLAFPNVDFKQRQFDQHAKQWNAAIEHVKDAEWILSLDADYVLSEALIDELRSLEPADDVIAYWSTFIYKIRGKSLRGSLYPPVLTLFRRGAGHYVQDGHTQRLEVHGKTVELTHPIYHDDRKSAKRWRQSQRKYALQEAHKLASTPFNSLRLQDKLRVLGLAPLLVIPYTLLVRKVLFDGLPGLEYTWQRTLAECYLQLARIGIFK
ncbi:hypothetical protein GCM10008090_04600 [Arenicella chitinivorans]|uniref:Glycosyltransferase 2-like domain-containing protein n=1 Tax=Arenicella chitinivorans TaxID=1329800 RepID=A0A918VHF9_9GAMM|nr:glycosyltransferase family 2 protein [Arenicella chitinivorans]GGZ99124.1 hypothetical protein GCM10008090_04600 [Arenicella chitinivorans]